MDWWKPLSFLTKPKAKKIYRVGISPGHGGEDPGALSLFGDKEADLARKVAKFLNQRLALNPIFMPAVYGMDEVKKNYTQRVKDSDANKDVFYIPIHFNASTSATANGWMLLLDPADVQKQPLLYGLAASILKELQSCYLLGYADWDTKKDGIMAETYKPIYELTKPKAHTLYLELGFLSNRDWAEKLQEDLTLAKIADAIEQGLSKYLSAVEVV